MDTDDTKALRLAVERKELVPKLWKEFENAS